MKVTCRHRASQSIRVKLEVFMSVANKYSENMKNEGIVSITFSDRRLGFYESFESVLFEIDFAAAVSEAREYLLEIKDGWKNTVRRYLRL